MPGRSATPRTGGHPLAGSADPRHLLEIDDLTASELGAVLDSALDEHPPQLLAGRGVALLFEKPSARTRNATEMAVVQLGGHPVTMRDDEVGLDRRESTEDVARTLSCFHSAICARVFDHRKLERMAAVAGVPVVNLLSDKGHPCQAIADLLTLRQHFGHLDGLTVAYVGDWNNVSFSLGLALGLTGGRIRLGCPPGYGPDAVALDRLRSAGADPIVLQRPEEAVAGADAVYTDTWTSMGQEAEAEQRRRDFEGWTVDERLMAVAGPAAVLLHCLPAHRGEEVSDAVLDGPASLIWAQAANRLAAARGALIWLLGTGGGR
jgi:ornithine carbamoyltransferase